MLEYVTLIAKGALGRAACRCVLREGVGCNWSAHLFDVALPCVAVVGDAERHYTHDMQESKDAWNTPRLAGEIWIAFCDHTGKVLAWASRAGRWQPNMGMVLCALFDKPATLSAESQVPVPDPVAQSEQEKAEQEEPNVEDAGKEGIATPSDRGEGAPKEGDVAPDLGTNDPHDDTATLAESETSAAMAKPKDIAKAAEPACAQEGKKGNPPADPYVDNRPVPESYRPYFEQYPPCLPLAHLAPDGRWVEVTQEDCRFVLGVLYTSEGVPTHLCYGVEGTPDRPLRDGHWVETETGGYWLVYTSIEV